MNGQDTQLKVPALLNEKSKRAAALSFCYSETHAAAVGSSCNNGCSTSAGVRSAATCIVGEQLALYVVTC
jgi:hypothetical protein